MQTHDIYLDFNATTPVDPEVLEAMLPYLGARFGNPSSDHRLGHQARDAVEQARCEVAELIGAVPEEIIFTGGGTEASNLAIRGGAPLTRPSILTTAIEHPATDVCCALLEAQDHRILRIRPEGNGLVDADAMVEAIDGTVGLVTLIHAQNEIGTLQPVREVAAAARERGVLVHTDAAQSVGKVVVDVNELGVDLLSIAGHKLYAPKGIGALFVRRGTSLRPLVVGGGQESGRRPGTENVAFIVGLGAACRLARSQLDRFGQQAADLSSLLLALLRSEVPDLTLVGDPDRRLPNTLNLLFPGVSGRALLQSCNRVMASNGSACHADSEEPSAVLQALGIARAAALGAVRLSLGRTTSRAEIEAAAAELAEAWRALSSDSPALRRSRGGRA